jgi:hypothetical protein
MVVKEKIMFKNPERRGGDQVSGRQTGKWGWVSWFNILSVVWITAGMQGEIANTDLLSVVWITAGMQGEIANTLISCQWCESQQACRERSQTLWSPVSEYIYIPQQQLSFMVLCVI